MGVSAVGLNNTNYNANFKARDYENPVNRKTERNLAILTSVGSASLVGLGAGWLSTCFDKIKATGWKGPVGVGAAVALAVLGLVLPQKLYQVKVNAFARQKEMDVFSRQKSAQSNIYEDINNEIDDKDAPLNDKINHYATVKMADNGNGVMIKGV